MTVGEMRARMTQHEYVYWTMYHGRRAQRRQLERMRAEGA